MSSSMTGKVAFVTGAGSGMGRAAAMAFGQAGARVSVLDLNIESARATVDDLKKAGAEAIAIACDVGNAADVERAVSETVEAFGSLDYAFNNAGVHGSQVGVAAKPLGEIPDTAAAAMMRVNLKGVWLCMKYQIRQMLAQGGGAIVNSASIGGVVGLAGSSVYCACKHGVVGLTQTAAIEYATDNIRVNAVSPGYTDTPMMADSMQRKGDLVLSIIPSHRLAKPEEIAATVAFLCSDGASYISGSNFLVDGGFLAGR